MSKRPLLWARRFCVCPARSRTTQLRLYPYPGAAKSGSGAPRRNFFAQAILQPSERGAVIISTSLGSRPRLCHAASESASADALEEDGPRHAYEALVKRGRLRFDPSQASLLSEFTRLHGDLIGYEPVGVAEEVEVEIEETLLGGFFNAIKQKFVVKNEGDAFLERLMDDGKKTKTKRVRLVDEEQTARAKTAPRGVYIHGSVGCGKTFVMDLFFDGAPIPRQHKRRVHFHKFMMDVHQRMHDARKAGGLDGDAIPRIARDIAQGAWLLCFDEFQVTDVADALIMRRLFEELFAGGTVVVFTTNRMPDELYKNGIQRHLFVPFIQELKDRCVVHDMDSKFDFRMTGETAGGLYLVEGEAGGAEQFEELFEKLCRRRLRRDRLIRTSTGRELRVPLSGRRANVARFTFEDLCAKPLGPIDFAAIADNFHTVFLEGVPVLNLNHVNQMRRLINLVDTLYDCHTKLVVLAHAQPLALFDSGVQGGKAGHGDLLGTKEYVPTSNDEAFAWGRTASRLTDMQSATYLDTVHRNMSAADFLYPYGPGLQDLSDGDVGDLWARYDVNSDGHLSDEEFAAMVEELVATADATATTTADVDATTTADDKEDDRLLPSKERLLAARDAAFRKDGRFDEASLHAFSKVFVL